MTGREQLLNELEFVVKNCCRLFDFIQRDDLEWQPAADLRTLSEQANYLARIPALDLRLIQGKEEEVIDELEASLERQHPRAWCGVMREGMRDLSRFIGQMTLNDYENGIASTYFGRTQTHSRWLMETITHIYHHRGVLFTYLQLKGYEIESSDLYET
jgi:uncharacterized damage-inducible protein DinB